MTEVKEQLTQHQSTHPPPDLPKKVEALEDKMDTLHQRLQDIKGSIETLEDEEGSTLFQQPNSQIIDRLNEDLTSAKEEIVNINHDL